uniref:Uncharacterized protein n=1 Tax=Neisseria meningitidis alpha153 TaxID=663926 RepID=C6SAX9_NEIME|nr:hypothetical protein predicted by Glimmer/Critica [Neisseria meningitidis alpha153]
MNPPFAYLMPLFGFVPPTAFPAPFISASGGFGISFPFRFGITI